jgi:hypothetical protein
MKCEDLWDCHAREGVLKRIVKRTYGDIEDVISCVINGLKGVVEWRQKSDCLKDASVAT